MSIDIFWTVGILCTATFVGKFALLLISLVFPGVQLEKYGAETGVWAVVTGASDGIGAEFAKELARRRFNLFLISRTKAKLEILANEITKLYNVEVKIVAVDFAKINEEHYEQITNLVKGFKIKILVNNVGVSHSMPVPFKETDIEEIESIIKVNCLATLRMTRLLLPVLEANNEPSLILTMGSFGGMLPTPLLATYSGSKAFLANFSTALALELANSGSNVHVKLVNSYLVTSAMSKIRRPSLLIPTAKSFASATLHNLGTWGGRSGWITPWWTHAIYQFFIMLVPTCVVDQINYMTQASIRKRALNKAFKNQ